MLDASENCTQHARKQPWSLDLIGVPVFTRKVTAYRGHSQNANRGLYVAHWRTSAFLISLLVRGEAYISSGLVPDENCLFYFIFYFSVLEAMRQPTAVPLFCGQPVGDSSKLAMLGSGPQWIQRDTEGAARCRETMKPCRLRSRVDPPARCGLCGWTSCPASGDGNVIVLCYETAGFNANTTIATV